MAITHASQLSRETYGAQIGTSVKYLFQELNSHGASLGCRRRAFFARYTCDVGGAVNTSVSTRKRKQSDHDLGTEQCSQFARVLALLATSHCLLCILPLAALRYSHLH